MDQEKIRKIIDSIESVFIGPREAVELSLNALFSGGHLLIVDLPGVGKTTLAKALSRCIDGSTRRVQFTPDLMPSDLTGVNVFVQESSSFKFQPGPVFTNVLLADEINRATPRTQSALLEAMEEFQVSVDGETRKLSPPFMVIATQNPIEIQGTFPLPEAQLDRFMISVTIGYPSRRDEDRILTTRAGGDPIESVSAVMTPEAVESVKAAARSVRVDDAVRDYILEIVSATRRRDGILIGASPRASLALMLTARTNAFFQGRDFVIPEDVRLLAPPTLAHRIILRNSPRLNLDLNRACVNAILSEIPAPRPSR